MTTRRAEIARDAPRVAVRHLLVRLSGSDAAVHRAVAVTAALLGIGGMSLLLGGTLLGSDGGLRVGAWGADSSGPIPALILGATWFAVLSFIGAPQILLIAAAMVAFGPWLGSAACWTGKVAACAAGFGIGRWLGADAVRDAAGPRLRELMAAIARRGFWVCLLVRLVPTVPSVLVNIAAGVTPIRTRDFLAGTAIGSMPKILLAAFAGEAVIGALQSGGVWPWVAFGAAAVAWFGIGAVGKRWLRSSAR
jgi:uncharacterized membrane protein YdjX (TVP38/TMEM64 family)